MKKALICGVVSLALTGASFSLAAKSVKNKTSTPAKVSSKVNSSKKIDINQADAATIAKGVKGIGLKRAEAIVTFRQQHGQFKSLAELAKVKGISRRFIDKNQDYLNKTVVVN